MDHTSYEHVAKQEGFHSSLRTLFLLGQRAEKILALQTVVFNKTLFGSNMATADLARTHTLYLLQTIQYLSVPVWSFWQSTSILRAATLVFIYKSNYEALRIEIY